MLNFDKPYLIGVVIYTWDKNSNILYFGWSNWPSVEETTRYVSLASKEFIYLLGEKNLDQYNTFLIVTKCALNLLEIITRGVNLKIT